MLAEQYIEAFDSKHKPIKTVPLDPLESEMTTASSIASEEMKALDEEIESEIRSVELSKDDLTEEIESIEPGDEVVIYDSESDSDPAEE